MFINNGFLGPWFIFLVQNSTFQTQVDVRSQLTFSKDMSNEQLALWLRNHPSLSGADYEEDISKLTGT
jgi:hypothetical protein